jgi:hypothetical protein
MEGEEVECLLQTSTFPIGVFMASGKDMEQAKNEAARYHPSYVLFSTESAVLNDFLRLNKGLRRS